MKPVIGITCFMRDANYGNWERHAAILPSAYVSIINEAGGTPLIIPPSGDMTGILPLIDGLVISGGPDLSPENYGQEPGPMTIEYFPDQDQTEMDLVNSAIDMDIPVFGVCRGMQLLSVMHGGSMHQHLDTTPGYESHGGFDGVESKHDVVAEDGSKLAEIMGKSFTVNSTHHQGVSDAGSLRVSAKATHDGLIEAVERTDVRFCMGVQWHPERIGHLGLYRALVEAARGS